MLDEGEGQMGVQRTVSPGSVEGGEGVGVRGPQAVCGQGWFLPSLSYQAPRPKREHATAPHSELPVMT